MIDEMNFFFICKIMYHINLSCFLEHWQDKVESILNQV